MKSKALQLLIPGSFDDDLTVSEIDETIRAYNIFTLTDLVRLNLTNDAFNFIASELVKHCPGNFIAWKKDDYVCAEWFFDGMKNQIFLDIVFLLPEKKIHYYSSGNDTEADECTQEQFEQTLQALIKKNAKKEPPDLTN